MPAVQSVGKGFSYGVDEPSHLPFTLHRCVAQNGVGPLQDAGRENQNCFSSKIREVEKDGPCMGVNSYRGLNSPGGADRVVGFCYTGMMLFVIFWFLFSNLETEQ